MCFHLSRRDWQWNPINIPYEHCCRLNWAAAYYVQYDYLYCTWSHPEQHKVNHGSYGCADFSTTNSFVSLTVSHFFPRSYSLSSLSHFNQPFLITDTLSVNLRSFTCHLWEMEPWSRRQKSKTRSCVSRGCWNRPGNSMDMTPGTLLDCQLASRVPIVPAGSLLSTVLINGFFFFFFFLRRKAERGLLFHHSLGHSYWAVKTSTRCSNALFKSFWEKVHNLLNWLSPSRVTSLVDGSLCSKNKRCVVGFLTKPKLLRPSVSSDFDALTSLCSIISKFCSAGEWFWGNKNSVKA